MKYVKKVDDTFNLKTLLAEHLNKFTVKNELESVFLDDVRIFIEKKSQIELQYAQQLSKLCSQFINKKEYQINNGDSPSYISIPDKWKLLLEQYAYVAEKKQVSSESLIMHCECFKKIKEGKQNFNQIAISNLKKLHDILSDTNKHYLNTFKTYCFEQFLYDQLNDDTRTTNASLEKKLKSRNINVSKFKKAYENIVRSDNTNLSSEKQKKAEFSKLNYAMANCCQNQQLQYYFSMEVPQLLHLQNAETDQFVDDCLNLLIFRELDSNKFLVKHFQDLASTNKEDESTDKNSKNNQSNETSEQYFVGNHSCFNNLIQFDLQPHDLSSDVDFSFSFQKSNIKHLSNDYVKLATKVNELEVLMKTMIMQLNNKRLEISNTVNDNNKDEVINHSNSNNQTTSTIDLKLEQERFSISEKKMKMIELQAKVDTLAHFNINLEDLKDYHNAAEFAKTRSTFETDLHQNLELWDTLMKSIDDIVCSDESYDLDVERKNSSDFVESDDSNSNSSLKSYFRQQNLKFLNTKDKNQIYIDPKIQPKFAKTVCDFKNENEEDFLSYAANQSLMIFDKNSNETFKAVDCKGHSGYVNEKNLEFYPDEPIFVKSVYIYEGLDDQELSFPSNVYIRLLRKALPNKTVDGEEWWEGVYENKIGYFPCIFVQELDDETILKNASIPLSLQNELEQLNSNNSDGKQEDKNTKSFLEEALSASENTAAQSPLSEYQMVPN